jgi:hypothetical protein
MGRVGFVRGHTTAINYEGVDMTTAKGFEVVSAGEQAYHEADGEPRRPTPAASSALPEGSRRGPSNG